jgi:hypothetical protein
MQYGGTIVCAALYSATDRMGGTHMANFGGVAVQGGMKMLFADSERGLRAITTTIAALGGCRRAPVARSGNQQNAPDPIA